MLRGWLLFSAVVLAILPSLSQADAPPTGLEGDSGFAEGTAREPRPPRPHHRSLASIHRSRPTVAVAAPGAQSAKRAANQGRGTWYRVSGGPTACGGHYSDSALIAAASPGMYASGGGCGRQIVASHGGRQVTVRLVDECPSCGSGSLDFSQGAFSQLAGLSEGNIAISWSFE